MNKLLEAAEAVLYTLDKSDFVDIYNDKKIVESLRQAVAEAKQGGEPVVEFQYKGATISGSAKDIAAVQEILASEPPDPVDALIAEIDGLTKPSSPMIGQMNNVYVSYEKLNAILDKYRSSSHVLYGEAGSHWVSDSGFCELNIIPTGLNTNEIFEKYRSKK